MLVDTLATGVHDTLLLHSSGQTLTNPDHLKVLEILVLPDRHVLAAHAELSSVFLVVANVDEERDHALVPPDDVDHRVGREVHALDDQPATSSLGFLDQRLDRPHDAL